MNTNSPKPSSAVCEDLRLRYSGLRAVDSRHLGIYGFDQQALSRAHVSVIGLGMNSEICEGLVKKGVGHLDLIDPDTVCPSNLNRQLYRSRDIGKFKATRLAKNLVHMGFMGTRITAYPFFIQQAVEQGYTFHPDVFIVGVDNDAARLYCSRYALTVHRPVIFVAVSADANNGEIFVQEADGPCIACVHPEALHNRRQPCPGVPASKDIIKAMSGHALYCLDSLIMKRCRNFNYRVVYLDGIIPDEMPWIKKQPDCPICGKEQNIA